MAIQISYPTATNVTLSDRLLGTQYDPETGSAITKNFSISSIINLAEQPQLPYKVYTALLTQSGTDAPIATILENTLVGTISFYYQGVGQYVIVSSEGWDTAKTTFSIMPSNGFAAMSGIIPSYVPVIAGGKSIKTFGNTGEQLPYILPPTDGALIDSLLEIRVYN